jgi:holo-[acyl-carrier protein] synthase
MAGQENLGIGIDLVSIVRIERAVERWGQRFLGRVFTEGEIDYCEMKHRPGRSLAARFAAKEAFIKAVSGGRGRGIRYRDIEVVVDSDGVPRIETRGTALAAAGHRGVSVSLAHEDNLAIAIVIAWPEVQS